MKSGIIHENTLCCARRNLFWLLLETIWTRGTEEKYNNSSSTNEILLFYISKSFLAAFLLLPKHTFLLNNHLIKFNKDFIICLARSFIEPFLTMKGERWSEGRSDRESETGRNVRQSLFKYSYFGFVEVECLGGGRRMRERQCSILSSAKQTFLKRHRRRVLTRLFHYACFSLFYALYHQQCNCIRDKTCIIYFCWNNINSCL